MVQIKVGKERIFYAHQGILSKCPFFESALNGNFKESTTREVELPEDDPKVFSSVLEYLYGEEYSPRFTVQKKEKTYNQSTSGYGTPTSFTVEIEVRRLPMYSSDEQRGEAALDHAKVYCLAEKLGLEELQGLALEKLGLCGPVGGVQFIKVAACLVEGSSDINGVVSKFLEPYCKGIPDPEKLLTG